MGCWRGKQSWFGGSGFRGEARRFFEARRDRELADSHRLENDLLELVKQQRLNWEFSADEFWAKVERLRKVRECHDRRMSARTTCLVMTTWLLSRGAPDMAGQLTFWTEGGDVVKAD